jgi:hypothetical protein
MSQALRLLDPTAETASEARPRRERPQTLEGATIGLLDINKPRGNEFLDRLEELLAARGLRVERFRKPRFSAVAPTQLKQEIAGRCAAVIEALAD